MNNKQTFDFYVEHGIFNADEDLKRVQNLVNILIDALYYPVKGYDNITKVDRNRVKKYCFGANREAINWGYLSCTDVVRGEDGGYLVTIEEAASDCPELCGYICNYMKSYGWDVLVRSEW